MGEKDMFDYWSQTYRVHNLEWSQEKAADILHAWQRKFTQVRFSSFPPLLSFETAYLLLLLLEGGPSFDLLLIGA